MAQSKLDGHWDKAGSYQIDSDNVSELFDEISICVRQNVAFSEEEKNDTASSSTPVSCAKCVSHVRVERVSQLRKGLHIAMPGKRIGHGYDPEKRKQKWWYMHHAIVTGIVALDDKKHMAELNVIHMWGNKKGKLELCGSETTFALSNDELYIVDYKHSRYTPDEIVERAEQALNDRENAHMESKKIRFSDYNVFTTNCEHFATWCMVGGSGNHKELFWWKELGQKILDIGDSAQIMAIYRFIVQVVGSENMVQKVLSKFMSESSDENAKVIRMPDSGKVLGGAAAIYVLYCLVMTIYYHVKYNRNEMCKSCYDGNIKDLWLDCSIHGITSVATYFRTKGCVRPSTVISCFMIIHFLIAGRHYIPDIRKAMMSPNGCDKKAIYSLDELRVGDIVTIWYWGLPHDVIVTEIHQGGRMRKEKIRAVHYALDKLFSVREVKEEYFPVASYLRKLRWPILKRHECGHLNLFQPEIAVLRAKQRIGEKKWHPTKNRSDHVCYWAKVKQQFTWEEKPQVFSDSVKGQGQSPYLSTWLIGEMEVHLSSDLKIGDVVRVKGTEGIVVEKEFSERKMNLEIVTVKDRVKQLKYFVNLNTDSATVLRYHPAHCHPKATRADRAKLKCGQEISQQAFMEFCILLKG